MCACVVVGQATTEAKSKTRSRPVCCWAGQNLRRRRGQQTEAGIEGGPDTSRSRSSSSRGGPIDCPRIVPRRGARARAGAIPTRTPKRSTFAPAAAVVLRSHRPVWAGTPSSSTGTIRRTAVPRRVATRSAVTRCSAA